MKKALLLSIKPRFADAIFAGEKHYELRKVKPKVEPGDLVLVYVTSPRCRLEGAFLVGTVTEMSPQRLWHRVRSGSALTKAEFMAYYDGKATAYAIGILEAWRLETAVELSKLRSERIVPPQGYHYLSARETTSLLGE